MINDIKRSSLANALVLHDFQKSSVDLKGWFYSIEEWFQQGDLTPTKMAFTGENGVKGRSNIKFSNGKKRLENCNFEGVDNIWIAALLPQVGTEMFDFIFSADLHYHPRGAATMVLCWDDQIIKFNRDYLEILVKDLYSYLKPAYGYGYQREFRYGPSFYPFGMTGGNTASIEEKNQIAKWQIEYTGSHGSYQAGMLRDIYPINFLSKPHLIQKIGTQTLQDWIESTPEHGSLNNLNNHLWSWWVPEDQIVVVREDLRSTGLLICV